MSDQSEQSVNPENSENPEKPEKELTPKLREDLISTRQEISEGVFYVIKDPRAGRFFRVREPEFWLISQFNGANTYEKIALAFVEKFNMQLPDGAVDSFARKLDELFFLETERAEHEVMRSVYRAGDRENRSIFSRMLFVKLSAHDPTRFLDWILRWYRPLHGPVLGLLSVIFIFAGCLLLWENRVAFAYGITDIFTLGSAVTVFSALIIVIILHELAHAVTCRIHGGEVRDVGFLLMYLQPCFYTDLSDAWMFPKKSQRLAVIWAGPLMQMITLAAAVFLWRFTVVGTAINQIVLLIAIVSLVTVLFNFNPLIKLDGYYLLSDWLEIPNLRDKSFRYLGASLKSRLLGIVDERGVIDSVTRRQRRIFLRYSLLAILYSTLLLGYFFSLAWGWINKEFGFGGALLLVAIPVIILRKEIMGTLSYISKPMTVIKNLFRSPVRGVLYSISLVGAALLLFAAPFTVRVSGEVMLYPLQSFTIGVATGGRIQTELKTYGPRPVTKAGFLNMSSLDLSALTIEVRVTSGDAVAPGDTLLALQSNQVTAELASAISELAILQSRLALLKSPPKRDSLQALQSNAQALEAENKRANSELTRKRELFDKNLIARNELEDAQSSVEVSRYRWESALSTVRLYQSPPKPEAEAVILSDIHKQENAIVFLESQVAAQVILSPISGRVVVGHPGLNSERLVEVINDLQVEAVVQVSDYDIGKISVADKALLKVRSFPTETFAGYVSRISVTGLAIGESGSGSSFMVATLFDNNDARLKPGMSGYAKIEVGQSSLFSILLDKIGSMIRVEFWSLW